MSIGPTSNQRHSPVGGGNFALHCRGDVRLYRGEDDCTPKSKKGRALLAILAAEQRPLSRVKIIDLLWSDRQEEQARASLRTLLADLKQQFNSGFDDLLVVDRERIALGPGVRNDLTDAALARLAGELFEGLDHIDPVLDDWLRTERERWKRSQVEPPSGLAYKPAGRPRPAGRLARVAVLLIALALAGLLYLTQRAAPPSPVVAVLKFKDLTGANTLVADGLAEELRIQLAQHPSVRVIGRDSAESQSLPAENTAMAAQHMLGATHIVEGSVIPRDGQPHVSIRLLNANTNAVLWSQVLPAEGPRMRTGSLDIAVMLAANINETVGQGSGDAFVADANAYGQVFEARRAIWAFGPQDALKARAVLTDVVARYPRFAPALAVLAEATMYASDHPWNRGPIPLSRARREAAHYAQRAIAAAPDFGPGYSALGRAYIETPAALPPLRRAVQLSPGSYETQHRLARALEMAGDPEQALLHQRIAAELQPLGLQANYMLLRMLRLTGRVEEMGPLANKVIDRLGSDRIAKLQFISNYASDLRGDLSTAHRAAAELVRLRPDHEQGRRALMWSKIYLGYRGDAASFANDSNSITALILRDDVRGLIAKVPGLGPDFWTLNWETTDASNYLVRKGRSDILVDLYEQAQAASGGREPGAAFVESALVIALRKAGKNSAARRVTNQLAQAIKESGWAPAISAVPRAKVFLLLGKADPAMDLLEFALRDDWWNIETSVVPFGEEVVFDGVRDHPRFKAILREYYKNIERERRELAAEMKHPAR